MITCSLGKYELSIDETTGAFSRLSLIDNLNVLGYGSATLNSIEIRVAHSLLTDTPIYKSHTLQTNELTIEIAVGKLTILDRYKLNDNLLERRVIIQNMEAAEVQLTDVRVRLQGISIGDPETCLFEAPGNVLRPRLPLSVAARQHSDRRLLALDHEFAPGAQHRWGQQLSDAPDVGPGLLIVHNPDLKMSLLTWYMSKTEAASPWVTGDGEYVTLGFDIALAGWLAPGKKLEAGTQYLMLHQGDYQSALSCYRESNSRTVASSPIYGALDRVADWNAVYEVHPGQFGGFDGLKQHLPSLADMGIDTIYLLPIQEHRNKNGLPWDENWEGIGSPYAIHDYEKLEPSLGTEQDFISLVDKARQLKMRVLMDFVPQGCSLESRYVVEHPEWFARDTHGNMLHSHGWNDTWSFDWANPDYQAYMLTWALDFISRFDIDGFRIDAPHGKEPNWDRNIPYHASVTSLGARTMLERLRKELLARKPEASLYCELFGPLWIYSHDISNDYHPYAMALALFERHITADEIGNYFADYWEIIPQTKDGISSPRICFTETHDTRSWPAYALRGSEIQQALLGILVMSGFVPMIWSGQEARQEDFLRGLFSARRQSMAIRRGYRRFNTVVVRDRNHYRHAENPADQVFTVIRGHHDELVLGLASLFPEHMTFEFALPESELPLVRTAHYHLRDLVSGQIWNEYGRTTWTGAELASFTITPKMYRPYMFRLEKADQ